MNAEMSDALLATSVAEALLGVVAAAYPELAGPHDMDADFYHGLTVDAREATSTDLFFAELLDEELRLERELRECGTAFDMVVTYRLVFETDDDMQVTCVKCAVVENDEGPMFGVELCRPFIVGLVRSGVGRPLCDRIRVFTYIVRVACQSVRLDRETVGFLGDAVRVLRELVRLARLQEGDDARDHADATGHGRDELRDIHAGNPTTDREDTR